jgi:H/ACA ribonucleoprotein complex subunit 1
VILVSPSEVGHFTHTCEEDIVCKASVEKVPYFNAPIYFENKEQIGKIDEIFGGPRDHVGHSRIVRGGRHE